MFLKSFIDFCDTMNDVNDDDDKRSLFKTMIVELKMCLSNIFTNDLHYFCKNDKNNLPYHNIKWNRNKMMFEKSEEPFISYQNNKGEFFLEINSAQKIWQRCQQILSRITRHSRENKSWQIDCSTYALLWFSF